MVRGIISSKRKLFHEKKTNIVDNYFVTDTVIYWAGNVGLGIIGTNARNKSPKDIEPFYFHKEKTDATTKHTKAARFFEPIAAVKHYSRGLHH